MTSNLWVSVLILACFGLVLGCPSGFYATTTPTCAPNPTTTPTVTPTSTPTATPKPSISPVLSENCAEICEKTCYCDYITKTGYCRTQAERKNTQNWNCFSQHFGIACWCSQEKWNGNNFKDFREGKEGWSCEILKKVRLWYSTEVPLIKCSKGTQTEYNLVGLYKYYK